MIFAFIAGILVSGCASYENKQLILGDRGWDEGVAISNLTKALLEDELGYDRVELDVCTRLQMPLANLSADLVPGRGYELP